MAQAGETPVLDPKAGLAAFEEDLTKVLALEDATSLEALGWRRVGKQTLLVPMEGVKAGLADTFLLRLGFQAYREWPPSAQFVNPETLSFELGKDNHHVPQLTSNECHTHLAYNHPSGGTVQLICCSATWEFYDVLHHVEPKHVWDSRSTFLSTIVAIRRAMTEHYQGRFANG